MWSAAFFFAFEFVVALVNCAAVFAIRMPHLATIAMTRIAHILFCWQIYSLHYGD
jgi:hypothetical protein